MKATSIFGGVQLFNIIFSIIRSKFVAIYLGVGGVGLMGVFQTGITLVNSICSLGISSSAIRDISAANANGNKSRIERAVTIFNNWILITGIGGTLFSIAISSGLSKFSFGNYDYIFEFSLASISILFSTISSGQLTVLKGMRKTKFIAKANLFSSLLGLLISLPLYFYFGLSGIVPAIIASSIVSVVVSSYYIRKLELVKVHITLGEIISEGSNMVKLGIVMTINGFIFTLCSYLIVAFITKFGGISEVGYYQAGMAITNKYVGLVFTAMALDYYPRLSAHISDRDKTAESVNQQAEVSVLILLPILVLLIVSMPFVIQILYSKEFLPIVPFVQWLTLGIVVKAASWSLGFIILSKGETKLFFFTELIGNLSMLLLNIAFYHMLGLVGLGVSFLLGYVFYLGLLIFVCKSKFDFFYSKEFSLIFLSVIVVISLAFLLSNFLSSCYFIWVGIGLVCASFYFSFRKLNKKSALIEVIKSKIFKTNE